MVNNMYMFNVLDHERKRQNEREFVNMSSTFEFTIIVNS